MRLSPAFLGTATVKHLESAYNEHILVIGADRFTRRQLAAVGCFNYLAAKNLTKLTADLGIKDLRDLYERLPPAALAVPHLGVICMAVLSAAFEIKKIGGEDPLGNWSKAHAGDVKRAVVTFFTMKHRTLAEVRQEQTERRRRKRARRNRAHEIRVGRFTARAAAADDGRRR